MMKRIITLFICAFAFVQTAMADQGMWLPNLIGTRIKDMKSKGFKLSAEDIYSINKASMKDAVVKFGGGCTGEIVSAEGLLLTNHHCGYSQIQSHSSIEHDYLTNGFWAMNRNEELPNPGLTVTLLVRMEDVTDKVLTGISDTMSEQEKEDAKKANIEKVKKEATEGTHYTAAIEPFYYGNQYYLFVNEVFKDVRLVAAPPSSIGKFGGDTDNWMWPRHTGDFSIFRIYAGKDNKPAPYSKDNLPYKPKKHFRISTKGIGEGDFTMIYGFPGSTQQFIISDAVDYILNYSNPLKINLRTMRLDIIKNAQDNDPAIRIAYAAKTARIANAWKKWQGESLGLKRLNTINKKREYENNFERWAAGKHDYKNLLPELRKQYAGMHKYALARDYYNEAVYGIELFSFAKDLLSLKFSDEALGTKSTNFYKDYSQEIDRKIAVKMLTEFYGSADKEFIPETFDNTIGQHGSVNGYVGWLFDNSVLVSQEKFAKAIEDETAYNTMLENDPAVKTVREFQNIFLKEINPKVTDYTKRINDLYSCWVRGVMDYDKGNGKDRELFPDANLTLRVAYGAVEGYTPQDAVEHLPVSTIEGIMEKDDPNVYDYDIPQRLRDIYAAKNYGRWEENGTVPVCFIATNHTTGGNSGSPVINAKGELVGINFDRTWLSTMSDIEFDPSMCRNISIDIRYLLFVVDKIGGAGYLISEMEVN